MRPLAEAGRWKDRDFALLKSGVGVFFRGEEQICFSCVLLRFEVQPSLIVTCRAEVEESRSAAVGISSNTAKLLTEHANR